LQVRFRRIFLPGGARRIQINLRANRQIQQEQQGDKTKNQTSFHSKDFNHKDTQAQSF